MKSQVLFCRITIVLSVFLLTSTHCQAQDNTDYPESEPLHHKHHRSKTDTDDSDHTCTVSFGGIGALRPFGTTTENFDWGGGVQVNGGVAVTPKRQFRLFLNGTYLYAKLGVTNDALLNSQHIGLPSTPNTSNATDAQGRFSAVTFDPTFRFTFKRKRRLAIESIYGLGGFGWFRRDINFSTTNQGTLVNPSSATIANIVSSSGVFDFGAGMNFAPHQFHGVMIYMEGRLYHGAAINNKTILVPFSVGVRW